MDNTNNIVFVCDVCDKACCDCKERAFGMGFKDGKLRNAKDLSEVNSKFVGYYHAGYIRGVRKSG